MFPSIASPIQSSSTFVLKHNIVGDDFYKYFIWDTFDDPTQGRVNYVDQATARKRNLASATASSFIMKVDDTNIAPKNSRGRDSNRIRSNETYTDSILVLDVKHMPWGCGVWPAFWTVTNGEWPNGGEIDIIEGVNRKFENQCTLHTTPGCLMDHDRKQTGISVGDDCSTLSGCGTAFKSISSYGRVFNENNGGYFVMKRTQSEGVFIWFFERNDPSTPLEVRDGKYAGPNSYWPTPDASFPSSDKCDFASHFSEHAIILNTDFCGDWAEKSFSLNCGTGSCAAFVDNNPEQFKDAYWEIHSLRIYVPANPII
ncbi:glycoside hydrolase family 16 protein [Fomitiporia mediterranea MF3/22]|uniref:glycoside hydrolase family 16 protein n=1 Tax=Fomitiporia mediterranea (strain MF3/22) TaxID=694068 RepID=UPI000440734D|nr:glycoside hydrolase family 16 protein [Fomitiporia mediterranea MF3/22]EJD01317.1 glycoside hydrolase family 16 protein [Fomitiporia mediterranea MF3/22]